MLRPPVSSARSTRGTPSSRVTPSTCPSRLACRRLRSASRRRRTCSTCSTCWASRAAGRRACCVLRRNPGLCLYAVVSRNLEDDERKTRIHRFFSLFVWFCHVGISIGIFAPFLLFACWPSVAVHSLLGNPSPVACCPLLESCTVFCAITSTLVYIPFLDMQLLAHMQ